MANQVSAPIPASVVGPGTAGRVAVFGTTTTLVSGPLLLTYTGGELTLTGTLTTARTLTIPNRSTTVAGTNGAFTNQGLTRFDSVGDIVTSKIFDSITGASGFLSISGALTANRLWNIPDRTLALRGVSGTQTLSRVSKFDANGDQTDSNIEDLLSGAGVMRIAGTLTANRTYTFPDTSGTIALAATTLAGYGITDAQPQNAKLTSIAALANAAGQLTNDGAGNFSYVVGGGVTGSGTAAKLMRWNSSSVAENSSFSENITGGFGITISGVLASNHVWTVLNQSFTVTGIAAGTYNAQRLVKFDAFGRLTDSVFHDTVTGGTQITLAGALTSSRTWTLPDRPLTLTGLSGTITTDRLVKFNANQDLVNSGILESFTGGFVATFAGALSVNRTFTFPDTAGTVALLSTANVFAEQQTTQKGQFIKTRSVAASAGTTVLDATDHAVFLTGATTHTFTLPSAAAGRQLFIKNRSSGTLTVNRAGSDTIDGGTTQAIATGLGNIFIANGTDWCLWQ